jgi:hypothetical protein
MTKTLFDASLMAYETREALKSCEAYDISDLVYEWRLAKQEQMLEAAREGKSHIICERPDCERLYSEVCKSLQDDDFKVITNSAAPDKMMIKWKVGW